MRHIVLSLFTHLFSRSEVNIKKHLTSPRVPLFDLERQLARQLRLQLDSGRRAD
ncbi:MAG: hypothetical protein QOF48_3929 [Verrucomicrobiota bacterium]|jgi:hypothetical protein